jgi:pimeloyl-ACP methyl ester carboxylesterase
MVEAAALEPPRFRRLVLIDPTILAPEHYAPRGSEATARGSTVAGNAHPAAKRRRFFGSIDEMIERLARRPSFASFTPAALRDYCTWGLVPCADPRASSSPARRRWKAPSTAARSAIPPSTSTCGR